MKTITVTFDSEEEFNNVLKKIVLDLDKYGRDYDMYELGLPIRYNLDDMVSIVESNLLTSDIRLNTF